MDKWVQALCPVGLALWQLLHLMDISINISLDRGKEGEGGKGKGTQALEVSFAHRSQAPPTEHRPRPQVTDSTHRSQALPFSEAFTNPGVFVCLFVFHLNFILFIFN